MTLPDKELLIIKALDDKTLPRPIIYLEIDLFNNSTAIIAALKLSFSKYSTLRIDLMSLFDKLSIHSTCEFAILNPIGEVSSNLCFPLSTNEDNANN